MRLSQMLIIPTLIERPLVRGAQISAPEIGDGRWPNLTIRDHRASCSHPVRRLGIGWMPCRRDCPSTLDGRTGLDGSNGRDRGNGLSRSNGRVGRNGRNGQIPTGDGSRSGIGIRSVLGNGAGRHRRRAVLVLVVRRSLRSGRGQPAIEVGQAGELCRKTAATVPGRSAWSILPPTTGFALALRLFRGPSARSSGRATGPRASTDTGTGRNRRPTGTWRW